MKPKRTLLKNSVRLTSKITKASGDQEERLGFRSLQDGVAGQASKNTE